jgi:hypothetical protein
MYALRNTRTKLVQQRVEDADEAQEDAREMGLSAGTSAATTFRCRVAILGGPALIGWLVQLVSWQGAFLVPLCSVVICAAAARLVAPKHG